jgi:GNAT superfamily N-acetyltransferase
MDTPSPTFQVERIQDLWPEAMPLLTEHWREIAHYQDIELDPDIETYRKIEDAGMSRCYTVRNAAWELVGYCVYFVRPNMHYRQSIQASQDVLFLRKDLRKGSIGMRLIKYADEQLKKEGVQAVYQHVKAAHNFGPMLERMGYKLVDLIFARRLDE